MPNFARLAAGSTWYRNATAVSGSTTYAVPAMLTGRYPKQRPVAPHFSRFPDNLFTLLGGAYHIQARRADPLCPPQHCRAASRRRRGGLPTLLRESADTADPGRLAVGEPGDVTARPGTDPRRAIAKGDRDPDAASGVPAEPPGENQPARFTEFINGLDRATARPCASCTC